jgi:hypothetical protein
VVAVAGAGLVVPGALLLRSAAYRAFERVDAFPLPPDDLRPALVLCLDPLMFPRDQPAFELMLIPQADLGCGLGVASFLGLADEAGADLVYAVIE